MTRLPDTYYGRPVADDGSFETSKDKTRFIDHACGAWFYGHDEFKGGNCIPWMRSRETHDRDNNDAHEMEIKHGIWRYAL